MRRFTVLVALAAAAFSEEVGYMRGQVHPDFRLPRLDGKLARLSDYRGHKLVLVNFASW
jgi:hypothetical protein